MTEIKTLILPMNNDELQLKCKLLEAENEDLRATIDDNASDVFKVLIDAISCKVEKRVFDKLYAHLSVH